MNPGLEQHARELLAAEYKAAGRVYLGDAIAIRAIVAALAAAPAADGVLSDAQCDAIYYALDAWARDLDSYDFGLPMVVGDGVDGGRKVIRDALAAAPQTQGEG